MPIVGVDCHVVIDGVGYIFADTPNYSQESQKEAMSEALAPTFGDSTNNFDPLASDLTMLLPIGQSDFSDGIGATDLEKSPHGYERAENLFLTAQNTLFNGPQVQSEVFTAGAAPTFTDGSLGGVMAAGLPNNYLGVGQRLFSSINGVYSDLGSAAQNIKHIGGYAGKAIISCGDTPLLTYSGVTLTGAPFYSNRFFTLNGQPYIIYKDGRIYAAFLSKPGSLSGVSEAGAIALARNWGYVMTYYEPGSPIIETEPSQIFAITKLANQQIRLTLPVKGYRGGPVLRRLWRTKDNDLTAFYLLADSATLGPLLTSYPDTTDDGSLSVTVLDMSHVNNSAINVLKNGVLAPNMAFSDTDAIFMAEDNVTPSTGAQVNSVAIFHDAQGNEASFIGCTNGLFYWNGISRVFQTLRSYPYHPLNLKYTAVNHGVLYYTVAGTSVRIWSQDSESVLNGPWLTHFTSINEIRLHSAAEFVFIGVSGVNKYDNNQCVIIYQFDGKVFRWSYRLNALTGQSYPVIGSYVNRNDLLWYETGQSYTSLRYINLNQTYTAYQSSNVSFRSAASDLDLPRLRKQIQGVMVRYLRFSAQTHTTLASDSVIGTNTIQVSDATGFAIGDWLCLKQPNNINLTEYRKIANIVGGTFTLSHALGNNLLYPHILGDTVARCGVVATLRNSFTDTLPTQDIEIGGPCDANDLFALIRLPVPVYAFSNGLNLDYKSGSIMELMGWAILTALNPAYNGLIDATLRIQDYVKLPNSTKDTGTAAVRKQNLIDAYNKGTVTVVDSLNQSRQMRFQRLSFDFEEPKERHQSALNMQATAHVRLIDVYAELMKNETITLSGLAGTSTVSQPAN